VHRAVERVGATVAAVLRLFDRDSDGMLGAAELEHALCNLPLGISGEEARRLVALVFGQRKGGAGDFVAISQFEAFLVGLSFDEREVDKVVKHEHWAAAAFCTLGGSLHRPLPQEGFRRLARDRLGDASASAVDLLLVVAPKNALGEVLLDNLELLTREIQAAAGSEDQEEDDRGEFSMQDPCWTRRRRFTAFDCLIHRSSPTSQRTNRPQWHCAEFSTP